MIGNLVERVDLETDSKVRANVAFRSGYQRSIVSMTQGHLEGPVASMGEVTGTSSAPHLSIAAESLSFVLYIT